MKNGKIPVFIKRAQKCHTGFMQSQERACLCSAVGEGIVSHSISLALQFHELEPMKETYLTIDGSI